MDENVIQGRFDEGKVEVSSRELTPLTRWTHAQGSFIPVDTKIFDCENLSPFSKLILIYLQRSGDQAKDRTQEEICKFCRIGKGTVRKIIEELSKAKLLVVNKERRGRSDRDFFTLSTPNMSVLYGCKEIICQSTELPGSVKGQSTELPGSVKGQSTELPGSVKGQSTELPGSVKGQSTELPGPVKSGHGATGTRERLQTPLPEPDTGVHISSLNKDEEELINKLDGNYGDTRARVKEQPAIQPVLNGTLPIIRGKPDMRIVGWAKRLERPFKRKTLKWIPWRDTNAWILKLANANGDAWVENFVRTIEAFVVREYGPGGKRLCEWKRIPNFDIHETLLARYEIEIGSQHESSSNEPFLEKDPEFENGAVSNTDAEVWPINDDCPF